MGYFLDQLKATSNVDFLNAIREDATANYQARIPVADQGNITKVLENLYEFEAQRNEFTDALVNRIGATIGREMIWENPLSQFKSGKLSFGDTVQEWAVGLLEAHSYSTDRDYLEKDIFGQESPESRSIYHKVNRQDFYKITINDTILRRAFLDEGGLANFTTQLMTTPVTSDNIDEFLIMCKLIPLYEQNGGFYHVHIDDLTNIDSTSDQAKAALRKLRSLREKLKFVSTKYNAAHMPVFAKPEELILVGTPDFFSAMDVNALAAAFNVSYQEFDVRKVTIPEEQFGIQGAQGMLTTKDFWRVFDTRIATTSQYNPVGLYSNYFLHHHEIASVSLFMPAILFWTGQDDEQITLTFWTPTAISISMRPDEETGAAITKLYPGGIYALEADITTSPAGGEDRIGVVWTVTGNNDPGTYVTRDGVLHIGEHETAATVSVTATTTAQNAADLMANSQSTSLTSPSIDQSTTVQWPIQGVIEGITVMGVAVANVNPSTTSYNVTVPALPTKSSDVTVTTIGAANVTVTVAANTGVVTIVVDGTTTGGSQTYTVTPTVG